MLGIVGVGEQPAVHPRVQRHDTVAEDRREPRDVGDVGDRHAGLGDRPRRPAARQQRQPSSCEASGELDHAGLVVHGQQRGGHPRRVTNSDEWPKDDADGTRSGVRSLARSTERDRGRWEGEAWRPTGFRVSDWLKAIGGVLFFVAGVLTWWQRSTGSGLSTPFNGFDYASRVLPYVIFVGIAILTIIIQTESLSLPRFLVNPVLTLSPPGRHRARHLPVLRRRLRQRRPGRTDNAVSWGMACTWRWRAP